MVDSCISVVVFSVCSVVFALLLRQYCREQSLFVALASCIAVFLSLLRLAEPAIGEITELFEAAGVSPSYISVIFKGTAICFITQLTCEICRDSGENAIASAVELWGRTALTVIALPVISALVDMIKSIL